MCQPQAVLITAAMPIAACCAPLARQTRLKIGIVGFGTFGQFLAKRMVQAGHEVGAQAGDGPCAWVDTCAVCAVVASVVGSTVRSQTKQQWAGCHQRLGFDNWGRIRAWLAAADGPKHSQPASAPAP